MMLVITERFTFSIVCGVVWFRQQSWLSFRIMVLLNVNTVNLLSRVLTKCSERLNTTTKRFDNAEPNNSIQRNIVLNNNILAVTTLHMLLRLFTRKVDVSMDHMRPAEKDNKVERLIRKNVIPRSR